MQERNEKIATEVTIFLIKFKMVAIISPLHLGHGG